MKSVPSFARNRLSVLISMSRMLGSCTWTGTQNPEATDDDAGRGLREHVSQMLAEGQKIFRFDTFGSEAFWGGSVKLHQAIAGAALGGVGPGLSPKQALELGLKVDMTAVPKPLGDVIQAAAKDAVKTGKGPLDDPGVTLALLKANAVVGVTGFFSNDGKTLTSVGIQCALCHSTVDDALLPGIGHRLDGWPNRDLNIGAIVATAPDLSAYTKLLQVDEVTVKKVLNS